jgi:hypothetical protein
MQMKKKNAKWLPPPPPPLLVRALSRDFFAAGLRHAARFAALRAGAFFFEVFLVARGMTDCCCPLSPRSLHPNGEFWNLPIGRLEDWKIARILENLENVKWRAA